MVRNCPQKECDQLVIVSTYCTVSEVKCNCGNVFCIICENEDHRPSTCQQTKNWLQKEEDQSENVAWMKAYTKPCPRCQSPIEKSHGCSRMVCSNCKFQFCWICLVDWDGHGGYSCKYTWKKEDKGDLQQRQFTQEVDSKHELAHYMFYFERYSNHSKSRDIAKKQVATIKVRMQQLHKEKNYPFKELEFMEECANEVIYCRQVLKWTYVTNFYAKDLLEH